MKKKILVLFVLIFLTKVEAQTSAFATIDSLLQKGRYKIALQQLENMPESFVSNYKTASIFEAIDNNKEAVLYYEKALSFKDDYATKVKLGKAYQKLKKYKKAISVFEEITKNDSENLLVNYRIGRLYLLTNQPKKAKNIFQELIKKDAENANYSYQLGLAYAMLKKRNLKINSFLETYKKDDEHIKAIHQLATSFILLRDRDSANIFIERGLVVDANHIPLNKLKANKLYRDKRYLDGIRILEKLDSLKPNEKFTQKMLGRSWYKLKNFEEAKKYFNKAKKIDQSDYKSYTYLGQIALEEKDFKTAFFQFSMATFTGKDRRDEEYYGLGQVNLETKKIKEAIAMFKRAYQENRANYKALYQMATLSQEYYKDKKIAYKHFNNYVDKFEEKDSLLTNHAKEQLTIIKKYYFQKGEILD
ncbi:tetratricopeptide repeat protein [Tenacibaculum todarodis]|nr:tetratricopeptide repeat protein [Tenacibaculum todarodis]